MSVQPSLEADLPDLAPGYTTSEFWLATLTTVGGLIVAIATAFGVKGVTNASVAPYEGLGAVLAAALATGLYSASRARAKAAHVAAKGRLLAAQWGPVSATVKLESPPPLTIAESHLARLEALADAAAHGVETAAQAAAERVAYAAMEAEEYVANEAKRAAMVVETRASVTEERLDDNRMDTGRIFIAPPTPTEPEPSAGAGISFSAGTARMTPPSEALIVPGKRLGKLFKVEDPRTLQLGRYLTPAALPKVASGYDWTSLVKAWPMYLNDTIGDCTVAEMAHQTQLWSTAGSAPVHPTDAQVLSTYEVLSDYNPVTGANDNGAAILDVLKLWVKVGFAGNKAGAYTEVNPDDLHEMAVANYLFGGICLGIQMPVAAQGMGAAWTNPPADFASDPNWQPGGWGGHCVLALATNAQGGMKVISWGEVITLTAGFRDAYVDEAYAIFSPDFLRNDKDLAGFNKAQLLADLTQIHA